GIKLDIMNSFPGTRTIRRYYKTKWNFCKGKFYFRKVEVEFSFTFKKSPFILYTPLNYCNYLTDIQDRKGFEDSKSGDRFNFSV
ncbi:MAG: hypothetical protein MR992_05140, partial [Lachnospiraceae bacterium]|nr:hypothetical protein [Lachnospiraceae bacterium]MDD7628799.1 hypothetical protein [Lachnospiraceae bacterium]MDY4118392.1 hypothetical protein [Lachnospiraceae bacterium]